MIRLSGIRKQFGRVAAVDGVTLPFEGGTITGLVGENGAGKSTLMQILAGGMRADHGTIELDGELVELRSAADADSRGIEMVHQHFMLVPELTIAENIALTTRRRFEMFSSATIERRAEEAIASTGIELRDVRRRVADLSVGEKSKLELIKAITKRPRFLILDEPTSVLTPAESDDLFAVMRRLAEKGTGIIFISHKLTEVLSVTDRIVIMRKGRVVAETRASSSDAAGLAAMMVERSRDPFESAPLRTDPSGAPVLRLEHVRTAPRDHSCGLDDVSLVVNAGTITAVIGVAGNGQTELAGLLRGLLPASSGEVVVEERAASAASLLRDPRVAHIPADRTRDGLVMEMSIAENFALTGGGSRAEAKNFAEERIRFFSIRAHSAAQTTGSLSGGNQQKVVLARELGRKPALIVAAEPARGLDIESTAFVHHQLREAAAAGAAILLITSDLDEAFTLASVVHVMFRGRLLPSMSVAEARERAAGMMAGIG